MERALRLAVRGLGRTHPNPPVGAVVVRKGRVVGEGFHRKAGGPHAEVVALRKAGQAARGATLYVTLEPCSHFGRTPPCVEAVLAAGIARVVVGVVDPNPRVRGRGLRRLRRHGVATDVNVLASACRRVLAGYRTLIAKGRPLVVLKLATSLDGRIATATGASRWITGSLARREVHRLRNRSDAVMVGAGTIRKDDPRLTCRIKGGRDPIRVVLDGRLSISPTSRVLRGRSKAPTWILTAQDASERKARSLQKAGGEVIRLPGRGAVDFRAAMRELGRRGVSSVLLEGGGLTAAAAVKAKVVDRLVLFVAAKLIGGDGIASFGPLEVLSMRRAVALRFQRVERLGPDIVLEATLPFGLLAL